ncbi:SCO2523 family variant P-loop protein [Nocardia wallacei]|uniref:SCO2523 family variant P-loop protein n=1 Tax=Nocardia TaxID=1817 RepID=UPI002456042F|nr:SCO2523 family variant P-loop protein [Nocardia wallacei]
MLVFSTSDKGGTGRSVTSCNVAYRLSIKGRNVAYLDFDFGSPTSGALFEVNRMERGTPDNDGLHGYLLGSSTILTPRNVRSETGRAELREPRHPYKLMLYPGDRGGAEFLTADDRTVKRCVELLVACEQEFDVTIVDLSAGRSVALEIALRATGKKQLRGAVTRWLVFHRWTRQHILATNGLVHGQHGLLATGAECGHDQRRLAAAIRYVRTAVPSANDHASADSGPQAAWLRAQDDALRKLATANQLGWSVVLGSTPMEPMLQWREQVVLDADVSAKIANEKTVLAFQELAGGLTDDAVWEGV